MKLSEMNGNQKKVYKVMDEITCEMIGGYENQMSDNKEESEEYKEAERFLKSGHDNLKNWFYEYIINQVPKEARFCGKEFILERIEARLNKWGY